MLNSTGQNLFWGALCYHPIIQNYAILNSDLFLNEDSLTEQTFFQAYRNWLRLLDDVSEIDVARGWHKHHDRMINDPSFSSSFTV